MLIDNGCMIRDTDFQPPDYDRRKAHPNSGYTSKPIITHKGAFSEASTIILKGVVIGERSAIGSGRVITCLIPADEIPVGNPAVFIRKING